MKRVLDRLESLSFLNTIMKGIKVISFDDDIELIKMRNPRGWEPPSFANDELDLKKEFDKGFEECEKRVDICGEYILLIIVYL